LLWIGVYIAFFSIPAVYRLVTTTDRIDLFKAPQCRAAEFIRPAGILKYATSIQASQAIPGSKLVYKSTSKGAPALECRSEWRESGTRIFQTSDGIDRFKTIPETIEPIFLKPAAPVIAA